MIEGEFYCECCDDVCYLDEGMSIETESGIQAVCPNCYIKYLEKKDQ